MPYIQYPFEDVIDITDPKTCIAYRYANKMTQRELAKSINMSSFMLSQYESGNVVGTDTKKRIQLYLISQFNKHFEDDELVVQMITKLIHEDANNKNRLYEILFDVVHNYILKRRNKNE